MDRCTPRACECHTSGAPASQNLEELGFLKSACSAAQKGDVQRLAELLVKHPSSVSDDGVSGRHRQAWCRRTAIGIWALLCELLKFVQVRVVTHHCSMQHGQGIWKLS